MDQEQKDQSQQELIDELVEKREKIKLGEGQKRIDAQHTKGRQLFQEPLSDFQLAWEDQETPVFAYYG